MARSVKLKLFKFAKELCESFGIYSPQPNQNRYPINAINWFTLFCLFQSIISTTAFIFFEAKSMAEYGISMFVTLCAVGCVLFCSGLLLKVKYIPEYIENWEEFIQRRVHSTIYYIDVNEKIDRATGWFAYCLLPTGFVITIPALIYTIVNYCILDSGEESFFLMFPAWYPFGWKTPLGYFVAWFSQFAGWNAIMITCTLFYCLIVDASLLFIFMADDITKDLTAYERILEISKNRVVDRVLLMKRFCAIIQTYSDAKQCVNECNHICEFPLLAFFGWNLFSNASSLWDDDSKLVEFFLTLEALFWVFMLIFLFCELGERVVDQFDSYGRELKRCDWIKLPIELQRMYLIFLSDTQHSVHIQSYGGLVCSRDTFKQVVSKGFSYFMTLRQFEI